MSSGGHVNKRRLAKEASKPGAGAAVEPLQEKDTLGIPLLHASFIKRNCKMCLGRGKITQVVHGKDGTAKREIMCGCATSKYIPARQKVAVEVDEELKKLGLEQKIVQGGPQQGQPDPEREGERAKAAEAFLPRILRKFGFLQGGTEVVLPVDQNVAPAAAVEPAQNRP